MCAHKRSAQSGESKRRELRPSWRAMQTRVTGVSWRKDGNSHLRAGPPLRATPRRRDPKCTEEGVQGSSALWGVAQGVQRLRETRHWQKQKKQFVLMSAASVGRKMAELAPDSQGGFWVRGPRGASGRPLWAVRPCPGEHRQGSSAHRPAAIREEASHPLGGRGRRDTLRHPGDQKRE